MVLYLFVNGNHFSSPRDPRERWRLFPTWEEAVEAAQAHGWPLSDADPDRLTERPGVVGMARVFRVDGMIDLTIVPVRVEGDVDGVLTGRS